MKFDFSWLQHQQPKNQKKREEMARTMAAVAMANKMHGGSAGPQAGGPPGYYDLPGANLNANGTLNGYGRNGPQQFNDPMLPPDFGSMGPNPPDYQNSIPTGDPTVQINPAGDSGLRNPYAREPRANEGGFGMGPFNYDPGVWNTGMQIGDQNMYGGTYGGIEFGPSVDGGTGYHTVFTPARAIDPRTNRPYGSGGLGAFSGGNGSNQGVGSGSFGNPAYMAGSALAQYVPIQKVG